MLSPAQHLRPGIASAWRAQAVEHLEQAIRGLTRPESNPKPRPETSIQGALSIAAQLCAPVDAELWRHEREAMTRARRRVMAADRQEAMQTQLQSLSKRGLAKTDLLPLRRALKRWPKNKSATKRGVAGAMQENAPVGPGASLRKGPTLNPAVYRLVAELAETRARTMRWPLPEGSDAAAPEGGEPSPWLREALRLGYGRARRLSRLALHPERATATTVRNAAESCSLIALQVKMIEPTWREGIKPWRKRSQDLAEQFVRLEGWMELSRLAAGVSELDVAVVKRLEQSVTETRSRAANETDAVLTESPAAFAQRMMVYTRTGR